MERPARMTRQPLTDLGMLVVGVLGRDGMDELTGRHRRLDCVEEADELLMPMLLHTSTDDRAIQHVEGCEQRGGAVSDVLISLEVSSYSRGILQRRFLEERINLPGILV